jgi:hypothetical protein
MCLIRFTQHLGYFVLEVLTKIRESLGFRLTHKSKSDMLDKMHNSPLWYFVWALTVGLSAIYVLGKVFTPEGLSIIDYSAMIYVTGSIALEMYLSPSLNREDATVQ